MWKIIFMGKTRKETVIRTLLAVLITVCLFGVSNYLSIKHVEETYHSEEMQNRREQLKQQYADIDDEMLSMESEYVDRYRVLNELLEAGEEAEAVREQIAQMDARYEELEEKKKLLKESTDNSWYYVYLCDYDEFRSKMHRKVKEYGYPFTCATKQILSKVK